MKLRAILLLVAALVTQVTYAASGRVSSIGARTYGLSVLTVSEVVTNPANPQAKVGVFHSGVSSDGGSTGSVSGVRANPALPPLAGNLWAPVAYGTPTLASLLATSAAYSRTIINSVTNQLKAAIKTSNAGSAIFQYDQEVQVQGQPTTPPPHLVWTLFVDASGRVFYGDPIVIPGEPTYIYAIYTPKNVASGLPAGWAYPNAGTLRYQILKSKDNSLVQDWVTVNVNGAYDDPVQTVNSGAQLDPDAGLKCLVDKTSGGCVTGYTDLVTLLGQTGAMATVLDYTRQLQPTMQNNADGTVSPKSAVSYDQRNWSWTTCTYQNVGNLGMELNAQTDRYLVMPTGKYSLMGQASQKSQAPTQPFNLSSGVAPNYVPVLSSYVFDVVTPGNPITQAGAIPNIVNLASITESGSSTTTQPVDMNYGSGTQSATVYLSAAPVRAVVNYYHADNYGQLWVNNRLVAGNTLGWMRDIRSLYWGSYPYDSCGWDDWGNYSCSTQYYSELTDATGSHGAFYDDNCNWGCRGTSPGWDITGYLQKGNNVITMACANAGGADGCNLSITITTTPCQ